MITEDNIYFRNNMDLIIPRKMKPLQGELWLGNLKSAKDIQTLKRVQIKTVITIVNNVSLTYTAEDQIRHYIFQAPDVPQFKINELFDTTIELIDSSLKIGSVLVHCVAGISRSATIVISYLMSTRGWGYEKALYYVRERRQINPNPGFLKQLIQFSKEIQQKLKNNKQQILQLVKVSRKEDQLIQHNYYINQNKQITKGNDLNNLLAVKSSEKQNTMAQSFAIPSNENIILQDKMENNDYQNPSQLNKTKNNGSNHLDEMDQLSLSRNISQYEQNDPLEIQKCENLQRQENSIKKSNEKIFKLEFDDTQQIQRKGIEIQDQESKELTIKESIKLIAVNKKNLQNYLNSGGKQKYNTNNNKESDQKQSLINLLQSHANQNKFKETQNDQKQIKDPSQFVNLNNNERSKSNSDSIILDDKSSQDQNLISRIFSKMPQNQSNNEVQSNLIKKRPIPIRTFATPDQKLNNIQNYNTPTLDDCSKFIDSIRQSSNSKINQPISSQRVKLERKRMQNDYPQVQLDLAHKKLSIQQDLQYTQPSFKSLNYQLGQKNNTENINNTQLQNSSKSIDINHPMERFKKGTSAQQLYKIQKST